MIEMIEIRHLKLVILYKSYFRYVNIKKTSILLQRIIPTKVTKDEIFLILCYVFPPKLSLWQRCIWDFVSVTLKFARTKGEKMYLKP